MAALAGASSLSMQCKICWGNSENPRKLFCGHTFCSSCINYFTESLIRETGLLSDSPPPCPICYSNSHLSVDINGQEKRLRRYSNAGGIPNRRTGLGYWFGQKANTKFPVLDIYIRSAESTKFRKTVPTKLKNNSSSERFINGDSLSQKRRFVRMECVNSRKSNDKTTPTSENGTKPSNLRLSLRSKRILESLERAEIKFLQPDSTIDNTISPEEPEFKDPVSDDQLTNEITFYSGKSSPDTEMSFGASTRKEETTLYDIPFKDIFSSSEIFSTESSTDRISPVIDSSFDFDLFEGGGLFSASDGYNYADILNLLKNDLTTTDNIPESIDLMKCNCRTNQVRSIFCLTCQRSVCILCIIEKHQNCQIRMDKEMATQLSQQLEIKANVLEIVMFETGQQIEQFKAKCLDICKAVNQLTDFIVDIIKRKHHTLIEQLDKKHEAGLKELTSQHSKCKAMKIALSSYCKMLKSRNKDNTCSFLEVKAPILKEFENNTKKLYSQPLFELNMFVVRSFLEMQAHPLGYIKMRDNTNLPLYRTSLLTPFPPNSNILEECLKECSPRKLIVCGTKCLTESNAQVDINSIAILPQQRVLLSSPRNYQVKLFSFQGTCLGELKFPHPPVGVCLWKQTVLLVTFPHDSKILFLSYEPDLAIDVTVSTKTGYFGLAPGKGKNSKYLFATAPSSSCVDILVFDEIKQEFMVSKKISLNIKPWGYACNLCQASEEMVVVADCFRNRVAAFHLDGTILFEIYGNDKNQLKCPADVSSDDISIFVSDVGSNRILRFDLDGDSMNVLLTSQDGLLRPKSIDIDDMGYLAISQFTEWPALLIFQTIKQ